MADIWGNIAAFVADEHSYNILVRSNKSISRAVKRAAPEIFGNLLPQCFPEAFTMFPDVGARGVASMADSDDEETFPPSVDPMELLRRSARIRRGDVVMWPPKEPTTTVDDYLITFGVYAVKPWAGYKPREGVIAAEVQLRNNSGLAEFYCDFDDLNTDPKQLSVDFDSLRVRIVCLDKRTGRMALLYDNENPRGTHKPRIMDSEDSLGGIKFPENFTSVPMICNPMLSVNPDYREYTHSFYFSVYHGIGNSGNEHLREAALDSGPMDLRSMLLTLEHDVRFLD